MDKIELTCSHCRSVLRVDAEHAGKRVKCPNCSHLSDIPVAGDGHAETASNSAGVPVSPSPPVASTPAPSVSPPRQDTENPYQPSQVPPSRRADASDSMGVASLAMGIAGLVSVFACGCLGAPLFCVVNVVGLILGLKSSSSFRMAGIITNSIALGLSLMMVLFFVFVMVLGNF